MHVSESAEPAAWAPGSFLCPSLALRPCPKLHGRFSQLQGKLL